MLPDFIEEVGLFLYLTSCQPSSILFKIKVNELTLIMDFFFSTSAPDMPFSSDKKPCQKTGIVKCCSGSFSSDFVPSNFGLKRLVNCRE